MDEDLQEILHHMQKMGKHKSGPVIEALEKQLFKSCEGV